MKILKIALLLFLGIIALALISAAFLEKEYAVEREIVINKPKAEVFNYVKMLKNQENYSLWATMDPE